MDIGRKILAASATLLMTLGTSNFSLEAVTSSQSAKYEKENPKFCQYYRYDGTVARMQIGDKCFYYIKKGARRESVMIYDPNKNLITNISMPSFKVATASAIQVRSGSPSEDDWILEKEETDVSDSYKLISGVFFFLFKYIIKQDGSKL
ncbi:hypothetical protein J4458_05515 [Candidatus Woesearchaeota archaeon]|nr:hypothetical protein [Candidatus Woesearchaeota archaeon]